MAAKKYYFSQLAWIALFISALPTRVQWTTDRLSEARLWPRVAVAGNNALFISGKSDDGKGSARIVSHTESAVANHGFLIGSF